MTERNDQRSRRPIESLSLLLSLGRRVILRRWRQQPLKTGGLLAIVALGVSVFLSIGLTNRAAVNSFQSFTDLVAGQSQLTLSSSTGALSTDDAALARQALIQSESSLFPTLETVVALPKAASDRFERKTYKLIGIDLLAAASHLSKFPHQPAEIPAENVRPEGSENLFDLLSEQTAFFATQDVAEAEAWQQEETVSLYLGQRKIELTFLGSIPIRNNAADTTLPALVMDLYAFAQIAGREGEIDKIEVAFPPRANTPLAVQDARKALAQSNPGHWVIQSQAERQRSGAIMTLALRSNLRALSALSLIVALLLVFQALDSSISRRKGEIAALRSLGVSPANIRRLWLFEAALIGLFGGIIGIAVGLFAARFTVGMVDQTVDALYYFSADSGIRYAPMEIGLTLLLSTVACVAAGIWPAREAARVPAAQLLKQGAGYSSYQRQRYVIAALLLGIGALAACQLPPIPAPNGHALPIGGYLLALALAGLAVSIACPSLELLPRLFLRPRTNSPALAVGLSRFRSPVTRHRLALGSVIVAVGMTAAMMFLIASFESTVKNWMNQVLQADIYVRSKSAVSAEAGNEIFSDTWKSILERPEVADGGTVVRTDTRIQGNATFLFGFDTDYLLRKGNMQWIGPKPDLSRLKSEPAAIINESFRSRFDLGIGDPVEIATPAGRKTVTVIGVQSDFGNERGSIGVHKAKLHQWLGHERVQAIALHLAPEAELATFAESLREQYPSFDVLPNRVLRQQALALFNQTFAITYALEAIGLFISAAGLGAMLFSSLLERRGEVGALRRIGMSRKDLALAATAEGLSISSLGILFGLPLGLVMGWVLIFIVNKQSFGWTLGVALPWQQFAILGVAIIVAGAFVSWRVGWWNSGLKIEQEE